MKFVQLLGHTGMAPSELFKDRQEEKRQNAVFLNHVSLIRSISVQLNTSLNGLQHDVWIRKSITRSASNAIGHRAT